MTRQNAYKWLSKSMGLKKEHTHIGMFGIDSCVKVIELSKKKFTEFKK